MKLASLRFPGGPGAFVEFDAMWVPVSAFAPGLSSLSDAIGHLDDLEGLIGARRDAGDGKEWARSLARDGREQVYGLAGADYGPCVVPQAKVLAVGLNYAEHVKEVGTVTPSEPYVFPKLPNALNGPYDDVPLPAHVTSELDFEVELAVVVGRRILDADPHEAAAAIAGYLVANDVSAREWQRSEPWPHMVKAKCLDGFLPIGPWLTTASDVPEPRNLTIECRVNGELRQRASTADLIFGPAELISFISAGLTLEPGDVILTGTPGGSAFARDDKPWLRPGDRVRCSIQGLGHIENAIE